MHATFDRVFPGTPNLPAHIKPTVEEETRTAALVTEHEVDTSIRARVLGILGITPERTEAVAS